MPLFPWRKHQAGMSAEPQNPSIVNEVIYNSITQTISQAIISSPQLIGKASIFVYGITKYTNISDVSAGQSIALAVTPATYALSTYGIRTIGVVAVDSATSLTVADGVVYLPIPSPLNGMNLVRAQAIVNTAGTTNATTIDIYNVTDSVDMLSTAISIASAGTVGTVGTINTTYDDVATNDVLRVDVTTASTTPPKGLLVVLEFMMPYGTG